jgi:hypothetical protein
VCCNASRATCSPVVCVQSGWSLMQQWVVVLSSCLDLDDTSRSKTSDSRRGTRQSAETPICKESACINLHESVLQVAKYINTHQYSNTPYLAEIRRGIKRCRICMHRISKDHKHIGLRQKANKVKQISSEMTLLYNRAARPFTPPSRCP